MRKAFALLIGLFVLASLAACSDDESGPVTPPTPQSLTITTAAMPTGYTCGPYNMNMEATGGTAPYTWSIADGTLPDGISMSDEGKVMGVMTETGDYTFTVRVTDSATPAHEVDQEFTLHMAVPSNPSMAIFFNEGATICQSATTAWTPIDCYVYIMLDGAENLTCAQAVEFKLRLTDADGVDLDPGTSYAVYSVNLAENAISLGDLFNGIAISFQYPHYGPEPIYVATFQMLLLEDLNNLSFKFDANPGGSLAVASCDVGYPIVPVTGREAAINY